MALSFEKDPMTGVYRPPVTVFNGGKRKTKKSKKTRKAKKSRKGRKGTRRSTK
jgi:hypothetical protein